MRRPGWIPYTGPTVERNPARDGRNRRARGRTQLSSIWEVVCGINQDVSGDDDEMSRFGDTNVTDGPGGQTRVRVPSSPPTPRCSGRPHMSDIPSVGIPRHRMFPEHIRNSMIPPGLGADAVRPGEGGGWRDGLGRADPLEERPEHPGIALDRAPGARAALLLGVGGQSLYGWDWPTTEGFLADGRPS